MSGEAGGVDVVIRLRELRQIRGLSQEELSKRSGVGQKVISSYESGRRIDSLKLSQLRQILDVYEMTEAEFFGITADMLMSPFTSDASLASLVVYDRIRKLPPHLRDKVIKEFERILDGIQIVRGATA